MSDLIELYVSEVGAHLPEKTRADIQKEIRSSIEDALDDMSREEGKTPDQEMIVRLLKRMGPPAKMAESYLPPRYLIGPQLYPTFLLVLRIVMAVMVVLVGVGIGVSFGRSDPTPGAIVTALGKSFMEALSALLTAFGNVVFIFAILQRFTPNLRVKSEDWDPLKMKPVAEQDRFRLSDPIISIVFTVIALTIFNLYPQWIGVGMTVNGKWVYSPVLAEGFFRVLPYLNALWVVNVLFQLVLLFRGRWELSTRLFDFALDFFRVVVLGILLRTPALINLRPDALDKAGLTTSELNALTTLPQLVDGGLRIGIGVAMTVTVVSIGVKIFHFLRNKAPIL